MSGLVPALLLHGTLNGAPQAPVLHERLRLRNAAWADAGQTLTPRGLMTLCRERGFDPAKSWLATTEVTVIATAATAGLLGVVLVGVAGADRDEGVLVRHSPDLLGVTIAMVPRDGGCWHG